MTLRNRRKQEPLRSWEEPAAQLRFAKAKYRTVEPEQIDTRGLAHRKIHPEREPAFLRWLSFQPCSIFGLTNRRTGVPHICWSPDWLAGRFRSDPMHTGKSYSGALKRSDRGAFPGCRHAHRESEDNMDRFDADYGINRHEIAEAMFAKFEDETRRNA